MNKQIKIAKIISTTKLVINAGEAEGIEENQKFRILDKKGTPVTDPDTGEVIGTLDAYKATVIVSQVYEHIAVVESSKNFTSLNINLARYGLLGDVKNDLNVDKTQITGLDSTDSSPIQVGDKLIKVND